MLLPESALHRALRQMLKKLSYTLLFRDGVLG
jgi:hypothetical protein